MKFPRTLKAAKQTEVSYWVLADALLKESTNSDTGPAGMKAVAGELEQYGLDYSVPYLRSLRQTAELYPPNRRHPDISLRVHTAVANPNTLDVIAKVLRREGQTPSLHYVDKIMARLRQEALKKREEELREARREESEAEQEETQARYREGNAKSEEEKAKARRQRETARKRRQDAGERVERARQQPKPRRPELPTPKEEDVGALAASAEIMANARQARRLANESEKILKKTTELAPAAVAGLTDAALTAANAWREVANTTNSRFGHGQLPQLSVVNE